jgi:hypothetical protein
VSFRGEAQLAASLWMGGPATVLTHGFERVANLTAEDFREHRQTVLVAHGL